MRSQQKDNFLLILSTSFASSCNDLYLSQNSFYCLEFLWQFRQRHKLISRMQITAHYEKTLHKSNIAKYSKMHSKWCFVITLYLFIRHVTPAIQIVYYKKPNHFSGGRWKIPSGKESRSWQNGLCTLLSILIGSRDASMFIRKHERWLQLHFNFLVILMMVLM